MRNWGSLLALLVTIIIEIFVLSYVKKHSSKRNNQLIKTFTNIIFCMTFWCLALMVQILVINFISEKYAIYVDYFVYPFIVLFPVALYFFATAFKDNQFSYRKWHLLLLIIPALSMIVLWTNDLHHLFYEYYSTNISLAKFGPFYYYVYAIHNYVFLAYDIFLLLKYSTKNTSIISVQTILIFISIMIPLAINIAAAFNIMPISIYATPISFSASVILLRNCNI